MMPTTTMMPLHPFLDEARQREHKARNKAQTNALIAGMGAVMTLSAWLIWSWFGVGVALAAVGALVILAPRLSPEMVMRLYRAKPLEPHHGQQLTHIIEVLADRAELPHHPKLYIVPSMTLNAFAAGSREHAAIALTEGLMRRLSLREITGVLAHEMSHIRNNDLAVMGLADAMSRLTQLMSNLGLMLAAFNLLGLMTGAMPFSWIGILLLYLAPAIGSLLQLGLSRTREFDADLEAANLTGDPAALADALKNLERYQGHFWEDLMLPVPGRRIPHPSLLRSHPTTEERLARLAELKPTRPLARIKIIDEPMISLVGFAPVKMHPRHRWPGIWF